MIKYFINYFDAYLRHNPRNQFNCSTIKYLLNTKLTDFLFCPQKSEIDTLEWANDNLLMLSDNMSSDTLFSTISQFPFPDSREIGEYSIFY